MTIIRKLSDAVYAIERFLVIVLLIFMLTSILLGVLYRYFLKSPLSWSEEFGLFGLVWVTFIGGSMSIKTNKAAVVSFIMDRLPTRARKIFLGIAFFITFLFCVFALYLSLKWITEPAILLQKSQAVGIPMIIPYIGIPLGMFCMSVHSLDLFASIFRGDQREGIA